MCLPCWWQLSIGTLIGAIAGYFGGTIDNSLMRFADFALAFPRIFVLILFAIFSESGLSFLGPGIQPPTATWGNMLKNALDQIFAAPWTAVIAGL